MALASHDLGFPFPAGDPRCQLALSATGPNILGRLHPHCTSFRLRHDYSIEAREDDVHGAVATCVEWITADVLSIIRHTYHVFLGLKIAGLPGERGMWTARRIMQEMADFKQALTEVRDARRTLARAPYRH